MANIRVISNRLYIDFLYGKKRYRIALHLEDNAKNRKIAEIKLNELKNELQLEKLGIKKADLGKVFPEFNKTSTEDNIANKEDKGEILFSDYYQFWVTKKVHISKSSRRTWDSFYRNYVKPFIGHKKIKEINEIDLIRMINLMKNKLKNSVINKKIVVFKSIMKELYEEGIIDKNPFRHIKKLRGDQPEIKPFTEEELAELLKGFKEKYPFYYNLVAFLAFTGCRPNEAVGLKWKNIDWESKKILIREGFVLGENTQLKTNSSRRDIPMNDILEKILIDQKTLTFGKSEYVFTNMKLKPINWTNFRQKYYEVLKSKNIEHRPIYQLRHTFASMAIKNGEDPSWVAKMLGHSGLKTTFSYYSRYIPNNRDGKIIFEIFNRIGE